LVTIGGGSGVGIVVTATVAAWEARASPYAAANPARARRVRSVNRRARRRDVPAVDRSNRSVLTSSASGAAEGGVATVTRIEQQFG
jgi:hypothetical protein